VSYEQLFVASIFILFALLLIRNRVHPTLLFPATLAFFFLCDFISFEVMITNFVNESLILLIMLLIISTVLEQTTFITTLSNRIFSQSYTSTLFKLMGISAFFSTFLNNTAVVTTMLSIIKKNRFFAPSRLLIPLSYAAILGGTVTLIGTSTNLIVNSFVVDYNLPALSIFDFFYVGFPAAVISILLLGFLSHYLLPDYQRSSLKKNHYFLEAQVLHQASVIGKSIENAGFRHLEHLFLAEIIRDDVLISPVSPQEIIQTNDILVFTGDIEYVQLLKRFDHLQIFENSDRILHSNLVESILSHESSLIGRTIKETNFRALFDASVVAIRRGNERLSGKIGTTKLQAGDTLILAIGKDFKKKDTIEKNFYLVSGITPERKMTYKESIIALTIFISAIISGTLGFLSLIKAFTIVLGLYLIMGFLDISRLKQQFPYNLFLIIGSALGLADVLYHSGIAHLLSNMIINFLTPWGTYSVLIGIYLLTLLFTEMMNNSVAAVLIFPIALTTATLLDVDPMPFIMAVAYGASASFIIPHGYQTNLLVYTTGHYHYRDFAKIGSFISPVYSIIVLSLIPLFFPF